MAQAGYTPISLYYSTTGSAVPTNTNLVNGELAINITDGKLYYKDNTGTVKLLASNAASTPVTSISFGTTGLTPSTGTTGAVTVAGTLVAANGGTGQSSYATGDTLYASGTTALSKLTIGTNGQIMTSSGTAPQWSSSLNTSQGGTGVTSYSAGDLVYYAAGTALSKLAIGTNGYILTSTGSAPQWSAGSGITVGTATNLAGGVGGSVPYQSAAGTTTFLGIGTANYVMTSSGTAPQWSSAITVTGVTDSGNLTFTGTGNRITGDFSNATVANRVMFQTSTSNSVTSVASIPNGTSNNANFAVFNNSDPTNASSGVLSITPSVVLLSAGITGTGTYLPMTFYTGNSERVRLDTAGNVLIGGTAARGTTAGAAHLDLFNGTAPAGTLTNGISLYSSSGDFNFMDSAGNGYKVGFRNVPAVGTKTGSYTLATGDVGKYVQVGSGGSITIPDATFAEGDAVSIFNNTTGNITITCTITTAYIAGTDSDKASVTLATRGVATILFISSTVCVITGNVS